MNPIVIYHRDLFRTERLIPGEAKRIILPILESMNFALLGRSGECIPSNYRDKSFPYANLMELLSRLVFLKRRGVDTIVIQSPLTIDSIICTIISSFLDYNILFQPFSQFTSYVLGRRLFGINPDVKVLNQENGRKKISGHWKSILFKKIAIAFMKACYALKGAGWIVLSRFEEKEISAIFNTSNADAFIRVPWAVGESDFSLSEPEYFDRYPQAFGKVKLVLWSRLDYELKGIDRLLNGIAVDTPLSASRYHTFLIGPDYAGGLEKCITRVKQLQIEDRVTILGPDQYTSGDHSPLAFADGSVLLSRWDGFPRSLRESLLLDVPVLVSPETHFSDIISETGCGLSISNPDCPEMVRDAICSFVEGIANHTYHKGSLRAACNLLQPEHVAEQLTDGLIRLKL